MNLLIDFSAIYWFGYEFTKSYQMRHYHTTDVNLILTFASGAVCGSVRRQLRGLCYCVLLNEGFCIMRPQLIDRLCFLHLNALSQNCLNFGRTFVLKNIGQSSSFDLASLINVGHSL